MASAKRELFKSPDVCEMAQLQPYVLRSWEAEFPGLGEPVGSGGRLYRRADVEMVLRIKQLVFVEGLTLAGARRRLEEEPRAPSVPATTVDDALGDMARTRLRQVRTGLEAIMRLLSRDGGQSDMPELQLVSPSVALRARARVASKRAAAPRRSSKGSAKTGSGKRRRAS
jgi:DNA-binding transcriptional MerR regulator